MRLRSHSNSTTVIMEDSNSFCPGYGAVSRMADRHSVGGHGTECPSLSTECWDLRYVGSHSDWLVLPVPAYAKPGLSVRPSRPKGRPLASLFLEARPCLESLSGPGSLLLDPGALLLLALPLLIS